MGTGGLERHLLAEHHPQRQFLLVDSARYPLPWCLGDQRAQIRVGPEHVDDGLGVRVEVEQAPASGNRRGEIAEVVQHDLALHMIRLWCKTDDSVPIGQSQCPSEPAVTHFLDAGHGAGRQVAEQPLVGERRAHR